MSASSRELRTKNCLSMSCVIRVASQNCKRPVELLGHHQPGQRMRQGHRTQREQQLSPLPRRLRPPTRRTHGKNNVLAPLVPASAEPPRKFLRRHLLSSSVQQYRQRRRPPMLLLHPFKKGFFCPEPFGLATRKGRTAPEIHCDQRIHFVLSPRPGSNMGQRNLHG